MADGPQHTAEQEQVWIEPEPHPVLAAVYLVIFEHEHADTCGVALSPDEDYPCNCWKQAVLDATAPLSEEVPDA